jgi:hypothetical protein
MEPVAWVWRWKFLKGWTKVWSCERHADELIGARRLPGRRRRTRLPSSRCSRPRCQPSSLGLEALEPHQSPRTHTSMGQPPSTLDGFCQS